MPGRHPARPRRPPWPPRPACEWSDGHWRASAHSSSASPREPVLASGLTRPSRGRRAAGRGRYDAGWGSRTESARRASSRHLPALEGPLQHRQGQGDASHAGGTYVGLQSLEDGRSLKGSSILHRPSERELDQEVRGGSADRAAVAAVPRVRQSTVSDPALDADPIATERIDILESRFRRGQAAPEARLPEALTNDVTVDHDLLGQLAARRALPVGRKAPGALAGKQAALPHAGELGVADLFVREEAGQDEVEGGRLGEHPAGGHAEHRAPFPSGEPQEAPRMGRRAMAHHDPARYPEALEDRVERIEGGGARRDEELGAGRGQGLEGPGHGAAIVRAVLYRQETRTEPSDLLGQRGLEARPLRRWQIGPGQRPDLQWPEGLDRDQAARRPGPSLGPFDQ